MGRCELSFVHQVGQGKPYVSYADPCSNAGEARSGKAFITSKDSMKDLTSRPRKDTNHIWFMEDGEEPHVIGVRLDCGDSGVVYFTREQAADLSKGLSNFLAEAALRAETPTFETIDGEQQTDALVVRNLAMLVRRLIHRIRSKYKAPDDAVAKQAWDYLMGEGLQGSILRARAETPAPREPVTPDGWISIKRSFYDELLANQRDAVKTLKHKRAGEPEQAK